MICVVLRISKTDRSCRTVGPAYITSAFLLISCRGHVRASALPALSWYYFAGGTTPKAKTNKLCGPPLQVDLWPFDLESGVRVTCDVGCLCANFSRPRPLCSRLRPDVRDRQKDIRRQMRIIAKCLLPYGRGHKIAFPANLNDMRSCLYTEDGILQSQHGNGSKSTQPATQKCSKTTEKQNAMSARQEETKRSVGSNITTSLCFKQKFTTDSVWTSERTPLKPAATQNAFYTHEVRRLRKKNWRKLEPRFVLISITVLRKFLLGLMLTLLLFSSVGQMFFSYVTSSKTCLHQPVVTS